ncbi:hypothetical protein IU450_37545 [Nocardia abscessus]|uniref:hypothetical protein n=1 Tax=Nocardia abscessus TaxID=120957 RepID=UPI0018954D23|nr:hypothetical protein [Nocardia abscessus]MBF6341544.1 hypothetical protein [Nocardia abscessus]
MLIVLAAAIPEILTGTTTLTGSTTILSNIVGLPLRIGLYGPGALLIREVVRRRGGSWPSMLILGALFAAIFEGLLEPGWLTPQLFPPHGHPYGAAFGVFWTYAAFNIVFHSIWSVTLPIVLTETLFHRRRFHSWLGATGIRLAAVIFILDAAFSAIYFRRVTLPRYGVDADIDAVKYLGVVVFLVLLALLSGRSIKWAIQIEHSATRVPPPWAVGLTAGAGTLVWFATIAPDSWARHLPIPATLLLQFAIAAAGYLLVREWTTRVGWENRHRLAVVAGALAGETLGGYLLFHRTGANLVFEFGVGIVAVTALVITAAAGTHAGGGDHGGLRRSGAPVSEQ